MALGVCIPDLIQQGKIPAERADALRKRYDTLVTQYQREGMARPVAETHATEAALKMLERDSLLKKRRALLTMQAQGRWLDEMRLAAGDSPLLPGEAARVKLEMLDKKVDALRGRYFSTLDELLQKHRRNLVGEVRNKSDLENVGRELFGEKTGDLNARELAESIQSVFEIARQRFNQAGGAIGKLDEYGLPQRHDPEAVRAVPFEQWRAHPSIENARVRDVENDTFATGMRREEILRAAYESIRTDGANTRKPGQNFAGALANRGSDARVIHFANFDEWMKYQREFGAGDNIYDIITSHIARMARDTVLMENMGPNPAATLRFQKDWIEKSIGQHGGKRDRQKIVGTVGKLQATYDELTGANKAAGDERIALTFSALRSQQVAAKLGSAMLSAVNDFGTLLLTAGYNDLPMMKVMGSYMKLWTPGASVAERAQAVRLGLVTDDWIGMSSSAARYTGEELTGEFARRLADGVIRGQGLARHTRNGQWAFGMQFLSHLTDMRARAFTELEPGIQRVMRNNGIGEAEWDAYRATPTREERGAEWIFPTDAGKAGDAILAMVLRETDYAIIMPDIRTRVQMNSLLQPGTIMGEIGRSAVLFKSFPWAIWNLHGRRLLDQPGAYNKIKYSIGFGLSMTVLGGLAAQLKLVAAGKDPQPMDTPQFLGKAVVQSGGLGLFGDLLYNSENSYGGGVLATLAGPLLGQTIPNAFDATGGNLIKAGRGEETEFVKDTAIALEKEIPGRNLWYSRLAWERIVSDTIREMVDPDADAAFRRRINRAESEGTQFFAPPGSGIERAPNLENITTE